MKKFLAVFIALWLSLSTMQSAWAAGFYNWKIIRGDTFTRVITWTDTSNNPINLTSCTVSMPITQTQDPNSKQLFVFGTATGEITLTAPTSGQITVTLSPTQTSSLNFSSAYARLIFTFPNGTVTTLLMGQINTYANAQETGTASTTVGQVTIQGNNVTVATIGIQGPPGSGGGGGGGTPGGTNGQTQYNNNGSFGAYTPSGDATVNPATGVVTVTKTSGTAFAPSATTDTTNASNITSGHLPDAQLPTDATTATNTQTLTNKTIAASEITGLAPSAITDTTNASNITSGTLSASRLPTVPATSGGTGSAVAPTSGQIPVGNAGGTAYAPQTVSGDGTLSNAAALTVTKTNGTAFASSATTDTTNASNISSGTLADARLSSDVVTASNTQTLTNKSISAGQITGLAASATTDTTNASNISSGTLNAARLPSSVVLGAQSGSGGQFVTGITTAGALTYATPSGCGTVNSGTAGQEAYYPSSTAAVSGNPNVTSSNGDVTFGQNGSVGGSLTLNGSTSGSVKLAPPAVAGTSSITPPSGASVTVLPSTLAAHNFANQVTSGGVLAGAQPAFADISGAATAAQEPATTVNSVGNLAPLFTASIASQALSFTQSTAAAYSVFGNFTGSTAAPTFSTSVLPNSLINWAAPSAIGSTTPAAVTATALTIKNGSYTTTVTPATQTANRVVSTPDAASNTVQPLASATSHQWVQYTDSTGTQHLSQPAFTDISGTATAAQLPTVPVANGGLNTTTAPSSAQIVVAQSATAYAPETVSGDATISSAGALTVTKTNGTAFAPSATTDTTNATNISSGTLAQARIAQFTSTTAGTVSASGGGTTTFLRADNTWVAPSGGGGLSDGGNKSASWTAAASNFYTVTGTATLTFPSSPSGGAQVAVFIGSGGTCTFPAFTSATAHSAGAIVDNVQGDCWLFTYSSANSVWYLTSMQPGV